MTYGPQALSLTQVSAYLETMPPTHESVALDEQQTNEDGCCCDTRRSIFLQTKFLQPEHNRSLCGPASRENWLASSTAKLWLNPVIMVAFIGGCEAQHLRRR